MNHVFIIPLLAACITILYQGVPVSIAQSTVDSPPAAVSIDQLTDLFGPVSFDHQLHTDYASCSECHHHTTGCLPSRSSCAACHRASEQAASVACRSCHLAVHNPQENTTAKDSSNRYHIDIPGLKGAYHLLCIDCHEITAAGPLECNECHTLTARGEQFYQVQRIKDSRTQTPAPADLKTN